MNSFDFVAVISTCLYVNSRGIAEAIHRAERIISELLKQSQTNFNLITANGEQCSCRSLGSVFISALFFLL